MSKSDYTKENIKHRIFRTIQIGTRDDFISRLFDYFIVVVIFVNLFVTLFSTFQTYEEYERLCDAIEFITIIVFTVEYILRIWTADYLYDDLTGIRAKLRFAFSFYGLVDLLTFFPYYLPIVFPAGAVAFRIFRVIRIFRLFKLNAQYDAFNVILDVLKDKKNQLLSSMCLILILMVSASLCMYSLEHDAQPDHFQNAFSGIWWATSTLLTVGYGDIYPITIAGKLMGIIISFLGVGMVAIPTGIISAGFVEQYSQVKKNRNKEKGRLKEKYIVETEAIEESVSFLPLSMLLSVTEYHQGSVRVVLSNQSGYPMKYQEDFSLERFDRVGWHKIVEAADQEKLPSYEIMDLHEVSFLLPVPFPLTPGVYRLTMSKLETVFTIRENKE